MATILEFRQHAEESRQKTKRTAETSAEIVIFPGVRYERWQEDADHGNAGNTRNKRDILQLAE